MVLSSHDDLDIEVEITVDNSNLDELLDILESEPVFSEIETIVENLKENIETGAEDGASKISELARSMQEQIIQMNGSMHSYDLLNSITVEEQSSLNYLIGTNIDHFYPLCIEYGRGEVTPVSANVLHWVSKSGEDIFSMYSSPTNPAPFAEPAYRMVLSSAEDVMMESLNNVIN